MAKTFVDLNSAGVRELLKSQDMQNVLDGCAQTVLANAGNDGFEKISYTGPNRNAVDVRATTFEAREKCYKENLLTKALGAAKR